MNASHPTSPGRESPPLLEAILNLSRFHKEHERLDRVDLTPAALRADLAGPGISPLRLHSTAEVIARAADLCCESSRLVHDNERRWRVFRERTAELDTAMGERNRPEAAAGPGSDDGRS